MLQGDWQGLMSLYFRNSGTAVGFPSWPQVLKDIVFSRDISPDLKLIFTGGTCFPFPGPEVSQIA